LEGSQETWDVVEESWLLLTVLGLWVPPTRRSYRDRQVRRQPLNGDRVTQGLCQKPARVARMRGGDGGANHVPDSILSLLHTLLHLLLTTAIGSGHSNDLSWRKQTESSGN
jgi:hypothetical protein